MRNSRLILPLIALLAAIGVGVILLLGSDGGQSSSGARAAVTPVASVTAAASATATVAQAPGEVYRDRDGRTVAGPDGTPIRVDPAGRLVGSRDGDDVLVDAGGAATLGRDGEPIRAARVTPGTSAPSVTSTPSGPVPTAPPASSSGEGTSSGDASPSSATSAPSSAASSTPRTSATVQAEAGVEVSDLRDAVDQDVVWLGARFDGGEAVSLDAPEGQYIVAYPTGKGKTKTRAVVSAAVAISDAQLDANAKLDEPSALPNPRGTRVKTAVGDAYRFEVSGQQVAQVRVVNDDDHALLVTITTSTRRDLDSALDALRRG